MSLSTMPPSSTELNPEPTTLKSPGRSTVAITSSEASRWSPPGSTPPGSTPPGSTAPIHVHNGVQWISFEYSREKVKMEYTIRCDVESVNMHDFTPEFKIGNCVYPDALVVKDEHRGSRFWYENECNTLGWALAWLNPALRGQRALLERAVDNWRNCVQQQRLRSRRLRRIPRKRSQGSLDGSLEVSMPSPTSGQTPFQNNNRSPHSTAQISPGANMHIALSGYDPLEAARDTHAVHTCSFITYPSYTKGATILPPISESPSPERSHFSPSESPILAASPQPYRNSLASFLDGADFALRGLRPRSVSYDATSSRASTVNSPMWEADDSADTASEMSFQSTSLPIRPPPTLLVTKEGASYQCSVQGCGKLFTRNQNFRSHMDSHYEQDLSSFICDRDGCDKSFARKDHLLAHQRSVHARREEFSCDDCGLLFSDQEAIQRHKEDSCSRHPGRAMHESSMGEDEWEWTSESTRSSPSSPTASHAGTELAREEKARVGAHIQAANEAKSPLVSSSSGLSEFSSSEDEVNLLSRAEQKRILLDRLMLFFYSIFFSKSPYGFTQATLVEMDSTPSSSGADTMYGITPASDQRSPESHRPHGRKRRADGNDEDEDQDNRDQKQRRLSASAGEPGRRLACPYFKKKPQCYQLWRSCPGPGWGTVHRVKEHLYRCHALPITCPRCHETFETDRLRDEHVRADEPCQKRQQEPVDGFDSTQKELLRSRKKVQKNMTEAEKWRDVYLILFPETEPADVPSPYYDYPGTADAEQNGSPTSEFARYEEFLRRELPTRVRQQLEVRIEEALNPVEESLRGQIVDIVRDMQLQLFEMYKSSRTADAGSGPNRSLEVSNETPSYGQQVGNPEGTTQQWGLEEQLEAFRPPAPYLDNSFTGFDGLLFDFDPLQNQGFTPDEGYGSLPSVETDDKHVPWG